jgi:hypothetical protein
MKPLYLKDVEAAAGTGERAEMIARLRETGQPIPQLMHLFAFRGERTDHLSRFTHEVMRGPSPLSPAERELIAAFTSRRNECGY